MTQNYNTAVEQIASLNEANADLQQQNSILVATIDDLEETVAEQLAELVILRQFYPLTWVVDSTTTQIFETEIGDFSISLYPNPSPGQVFVSCTQTINRIVVYNTTGQVVRDFAPFSTETTFEVRRDEIAPGLFFVQIWTPLGWSSHRLVMTAPR